MKCADRQPVEEGAVSSEACHLSLEAPANGDDEKSVCFTVVNYTDQSLVPWPRGGHRATYHELRKGSLQMMGKGTHCLVYYDLTAGWIKLCCMSI